MHDSNDEILSHVGGLEVIHVPVVSPPVFDEMDSARVVFRSLLRDPEAAREHHHETAELILNLGPSLGSVAWRNVDGDQQTATLESKACCLIPGGVTHLVSSLQVDGVMSVLIGGALLTELTRRNNGVMVESLRQLTSHDALAGGLLSEFGRLMVKPPGAFALHALGVALALKLLHAILYPKNGDGAEYPPLTPSEQHQVLDHIGAHLTDRVAISKLARELSLSRTHFTRRFRATFGMSPLQYALKMRVDRAIELLRTGEYRVAEAAYALGFCDQSHFDRHCHKFYGVTPSALLRSAR